MKIIWSNVVLYAVTVVAMIVYGNAFGDDGVGSFLAAIFLWLMVFITYAVGYRRGKAGKSDGYFIERS